MFEVKCLKVFTVKEFANGKVGELKMAPIKRLSNQAATQFRNGDLTDDIAWLEGATGGRHRDGMLKLGDLEGRVGKCDEVQCHLSCERLLSGDSL